MKETMKKVWNVITTILTVLAVTVAVIAVFSVVTINRNDRSLFGFRFFICLSDSMKATDFAAGDLVVSKNTDPSEIKEGDIISYVSVDPESNGQIITHKVKKVEEDQGLYFFTTYGTTTGVEDRTRVQGVNVLGKYVFHIPKVGYFFDFLKTTPGYICCIFIPFAFLIVLNIVNTVKSFRAYKKDEMDKLVNERKALADQKAETERMMRELEQLKGMAVEKTETAPDKVADATEDDTAEAEKKPAEAEKEPEEEAEEKVEETKES